MSSGLSRSTHLSYSSGQRRFINFCLDFSLVNPDGSILPASESTILRFIGYLAFSVKPSTIKTYLAAVRSLHIYQGYQNPLENNPRIQLVLRGIKRLSGNPRRLRCPITPKLLLIFRSRLDLSLYDHCLYWAAFCVAFFGFLRSGEFTVTRNLPVGDCLQISDLSVDSAPFPNLIRLRVKVSKADPFRESCTVVMGRNGSLLCPVEALLKYLHFRGSHDGPLFVFEDGSPLTREKLNLTISSLLALCNVSGDFTGHSFRIGAATTAAHVGISDHWIKTLGRWSSDAYKLYIRSSEGVIASFSKSLVSGC